MTTSAGRKLYSLVCRICSDDTLPDKWIHSLLDTLQARAVDTQVSIFSLHI